MEKNALALRNEMHDNQFVLLPEVVSLLQSFQTDNGWCFEALDNIRNCFIELSFKESDVDFMEHLREIMLIEKFLKGIANVHNE